MFITKQGLIIPGIAGPAGRRGLRIIGSGGIVGNPPVNTVAPAVSGTATSGQTLTSTTGTWTGDATITYAYQWKWADSNTVIIGATSSTYLLLAGDVGHTIKCVVTASNGVGSQSQDSNTTSSIAASGGAAVTWNPADKDGITLSGGNLQAASDGGTGNHMVRATTPGVAGRYFELTSADGNYDWGVQNLVNPASTGYGGNPVGIVAFNNSYVEWTGGSSFNGAVAYGGGDIVGLLLEADTVSITVNGGQFAGLFNPPALPGGDLYPFVQPGNSTPVIANFGASTMAHLPVGATSWDGSQSN